MMEICRKENCNEPCALDKHGKPHKFCIDHQRERWKEKAEKRRLKLNGGVKRPPGRPKGTGKKAPVQQPSAAEPIISAPTTTTAPTPAAPVESGAKFLVQDLRSSRAKLYEARPLSHVQAIVPEDPEAYARFIREAQHAGYNIVLEA